MSEYRLNAYHIMWIFVFFDLPVMTKRQRKESTIFRKNLEKDGFTMFQYSVYIRHCPSKESMEVHVKRVKAFIPDSGMVSILTVTGKQFGDILNFYGKAEKEKIETPQQLEFF